MKKKSNSELSTQLMRKLLGSITFEEIQELEKEELNDDQLKMRRSDIELFYNQWGKKMLKLLIYKQLEAIAKIDGSRLFGSGTINGIKLVMELLEEKTMASISRHDEDETDEDLPLL